MTDIHSSILHIQCTPLYLACENGHKDCVELLIKKGACVTYTHMEESTQSGDSLREDVSMNEDWRSVNCFDAAIDKRHT